MTADILTVFPKDQVLTPSDGQAYEDSIQRWADNAVKRAKFVVKAKSAQDVSKAVRQTGSHLDLQLHSRLTCSFCSLPRTVLM